MAVATKNIVIIDDEPMILKSLKRELELYTEDLQLGIETFNSGKDALDYLKNEGDSVFLTISDLRMPDISGTEVISHMNTHYPHIKTFLLTAFSDIQAIQSAIKSSIDRLIMKPWDQESLKNDIKNAYSSFSIEEENRKLQAEIDYNIKMAAEFQKNLFPKSIYLKGSMELDISYTPLEGTQCSGDFYDYIDIDDNSRVLMLGDVSGHGIKPAFVTGMLKVLGSINKGRLYSKKDINPSDIIEHMNQGLIQSLGGISDIIVTFTTALIDIEKKLLKVAGAGHLPVYILRNGKIISIHEENVAMGFLHESQYENKTAQLESNDLIIFFTDGLIDAHKKVMELSRVESLLLTLNLENNPSQKIYECFRSSHSEGFSDDVTIICNRIL